MTSVHRFALGALLMFLMATMATAAEPKAKPLFDGKTLDGWKVLGDGCEIEAADGCIFMKAGNGVLMADKQYGDFILECDWKALNEEMWDAGIYFRADLPPKGRPWPKRYQVNMRKAEEGAMPGVKETVTKDLYKPGEWNHFKMTVEGDTVSLEFNGKKAWTYKGLEQAKGHLCLQCEVPGGGQFLFKNVTLVDLDEEN